MSYSAQHNPNSRAYLLMQRPPSVLPTRLQQSGLQIAALWLVNSFHFVSDGLVVRLKT